MSSSNPSSDHNPETPAVEGAAPAAPEVAKPSVDPRKGLPPVAKAEVIKAEGGPDRPKFGGGGGKFGDRPKREKPVDNQEKAPNTRDALRSVSDEAKKGTSDDAILAAEIEAMMSDAADDANKMRPAKNNRNQAPTGVKPIGGVRPAQVRGPRKVESGREHRKGKVVSIGPTDIFIEFGPKELGVLPRTSYKEEDTLPKAGEEIEVVIEKFESAEQLFICSRPGTVVKAAWELLEVGQIVEGRVTGVNKGGLEIEVAGHRAFMPAGQVSLDRVADLSVFVGEKFTCEVAQIDRRGQGNLVLSRRNLLNQERKAKAAKLKETLSEGLVLDGVVRKIMPFGAFIDIGGMDGLCHIADMTYDRVAPSEKNVAKFVKEGESVKVQILKMDLENDRISLGMKQLSADPFVTATSDVTEGATVNGRVVRIAEFGAFVEIAPGVDGMVHISEISRKRVAKVEDHLKLDQVVTAQVLKIDGQTRKISLSIKALEAEKPPEPGTREYEQAQKRADRAKKDQERLAEINKETPALRRQREQFRNKQLGGGFGKNMDFLGQGLGGLSLGK
jgi:predicted RNA-binding protein with RPS1 domain